MIRIIDAENSEENCTKAKFGHKTEYVDVKARSAFKTKKHNNVNDKMRTWE